MKASSIMTGSGGDVSPILAGFLDHRVSARITDFDHYRIHGGVAVETDYIISVACMGDKKKTRQEPDFDAFTISKTFSHFRTLADQLRDAAEAFMSTAKGGDVPTKVMNLAKYCENVFQLIESQRTQYLGKVNFMYVKLLAKQRSQIIADVLDTTLTHFPDEVESHPFLKQVAQKIEAFFLTDHCGTADDDADDEADETATTTNVSSLLFTPMKNINPIKNIKELTNIKKHYRNLATGDKTEEKAVPETPNAGVVDSMPLPGLKRQVTSPVVPMTRKTRPSQKTRQSEEKALAETAGQASLLVDDDRSQADLVPSYEAPVSTVSSSMGTSWLGTFIDTNPFIFLGIFAVAMQVLRMSGSMVVTIDLDILLLIAFASFCLGLHTPRPMVGGVDKPPLKRRGRRRTGIGGTPSDTARLLRRSMISTTPRSISSGGTPTTRRVSLLAGPDFVMEEIEAEVEEGEEDTVVLQSPMPRFPDGAPLGSEHNCWSDAPADSFHVRGDNYLSDKKKVASGPFLFQARGIDLFLTDACPENVGRISGIMGGQLRTVPTFLINFRLPWGVLIFYYEIPERFLPFIKGCYGDSSVDKAQLEQTIKTMNNQDRCCARFLLGNDEHKNNTLKIFPGVVEGPWVVKSVVGGKPAIIGTKLPVNYVYEPEGTAHDGTKHALYLEADLDIVSSSAARGVLSVTRTYTQDLTLDLGFAIQGNSKDELREQMLVGTRLHGIDPMTAPPLPPMKDMLFDNPDKTGDDDSVS